MAQDGVRVVVADDHPLYRAALRGAVEAASPGAEVPEAGTFEELLAAVEAGGADLVLLDLGMPGAEGLSGLLVLRAAHPSVPVMVVSGTDDRATVRRCLDFGASGFVPKTAGAAETRRAIREVLRGETPVPADLGEPGEEDREGAAVAQRLASLTPQQARVMGRLSRGLLNKQIAFELGVSEATIKAHVSAILQKLGVDSRTQAVILASRILSPQGLPSSHDLGDLPPEREGGEADPLPPEPGRAHA